MTEPQDDLLGAAGPSVDQTPTGERTPPQIAYSEYAGVNGWVVGYVGTHTCGGGTPEVNGMHEEWCGWEPLFETKIPENAQGVADDFNELLAWGKSLTSDADPPPDDGHVHPAWLPCLAGCPAYGTRQGPLADTPTDERLRAVALTTEVVARLWREHVDCTWLSDGTNVRWSCGIIHGLAGGSTRGLPIHMQPTTLDRHLAALVMTQVEADIAAVERILSDRLAAAEARADRAESAIRATIDYCRLSESFASESTEPAAVGLARAYKDVADRLTAAAQDPAVEQGCTDPDRSEGHCCGDPR